MRDSQSLLDQVIAFAGKEIRVDLVETVLGIAGQDILKGFIDNLIDRNLDSLIAGVGSILNSGKDLNYFCRDLTEYVRNLLIIKLVKDPEVLLDPQVFDIKVLKEQGGKFDVDELHQIFIVFSRTESEMKRATLPQMVFEMAILRLIDVRPMKSIDAMIETINQMGDEKNAGSSNMDSQALLSSPRGSPDSQKISEIDNPKIQKDSSSQISGLVEESPSGESFSSGKDVQTLWEKARLEMVAQRNLFSYLFEDCEVVFSPPAKLYLEFLDPFTRDLVEKEENKKLIMKIIEQVFGMPIELELGVRKQKNSEVPETRQVQEEKKTIYKDEKNYQSKVQIIQDAIDIFDGKVIR